MSTSDPELRELRLLAAKLADERQADILLYGGDIARPADLQLVSGRGDHPRRRNVLLVLRTLGGSADAAYRIARALQQRYARLTIYIDDYCKSAGTLLALGADELVISDYGELGPLDFQPAGSVELGRMSSGLTPIQALNTLRTEVVNLFEAHFARLRGGRLPITTRIAAERASEMAIGLFSPIYAQIDPVQLGEVDRIMSTARRYGERIARGNLKDGALERLVAYYPSHDFVVDREEARQLFYHVREPTTDEEDFLKQVEPIVSDGQSPPRFIYLDEFLQTAERGAVIAPGGAAPTEARPEGRRADQDSGV